MKNTVVLTVVVLMLACVLPMAQVQRTVAAQEHETKQKQTQAELQQKQKELQFQLQELEAKRLELKAQLQALDAVRQAEQAKKFRVQEQKVKVEEQKAQVAKVQVQPKQMREWQEHLQAWQTGDAMKQWRKDMEEWAQKQAQISLGQAKGPLPPAPAMPAMPVMPAMPAIPSAPAPSAATVSEAAVVPVPPKVQHKYVTVITPHASAHASADADATVVESSTSEKVQSIVVHSPKTVRTIQSIKEKEKGRRCTIERVEAQTLPLSSGAVLNVTNEDGKINVKRSTFSNGRIVMEDGQIECEDVNGSLACAVEDGTVKVAYADDLLEACSIAVTVSDGQIEFSAPSAMFGPDAPEAAKRIGEGAEWKTVAGNRTVFLKAQEGSIKVQKR